MFAQCHLTRMMAKEAGKLEVRHRTPMTGVPCSLVIQRYFNTAPVPEIFILRNRET